MCTRGTDVFHLPWQTQLPSSSSHCPCPRGWSNGHSKSKCLLAFGGVWPVRTPRKLERRSGMGGWCVYSITFPVRLLCVGYVPLLKAPPLACSLCHKGSFQALVTDSFPAPSGLGFVSIDANPKMFHFSVAFPRQSCHSHKLSLYCVLKYVCCLVVSDSFLWLHGL